MAGSRENITGETPKGGRSDSLAAEKTASSRNNDRAKGERESDDIEMKLLLDAIYLKYHYDFREYAVASLKRERFEEVMADIVADTFRLVLTNWAVIASVAVELRSGHHLSGADLERLIDGRVVVPAEVVIWEGSNVH